MNTKHFSQNELILIDYELPGYINEFNQLIKKEKNSILIRCLTPLTIRFLKEIERFRSVYNFELYFLDSDKSKIVPEGTLLYDGKREINAVFVFSESSADNVLLEFLGKPGIVCVAPARNAFKEVVVISVPKSGTNLLFRMLHVMGYEGVGDVRTPEPKKYYFLGETQHLTYDHYKVLNIYERSFFLYHPVLFNYRDPRDVLFSNFNYLSLIPKNSFSEFVLKGHTRKEQFKLFMEMIFDIGYVGESLQSFSRWLNFSKYNVTPLRFEDLIGPEGGGDMERQLHVLWNLQLKLLVPGKVANFADKIFSTQSPTFFKGKIGAYKDFFQQEEYALFEEFNEKYGDLVKKFGY